MEIAHCSTVPTTIKKLSIWYSSIKKRNLSRAWQPLSRVNVTGLLRRLQVKIENIYLFKILIKKHENVFKSWLCPNFLLLPKKSELPEIWGECSPPRPPPARTPMHLCITLYGDAILVHSFDAPIWPPKINKNIWSSLFL